VLSILRRYAINGIEATEYLNKLVKEALMVNLGAELKVF